MSIVLQGSTSGSVTLQEPAVAGTTVLTLPAVSGTIITTGTTGQVIASGALPIGSVLQVVNTGFTNYTQTTSNTYGSITGATISITPKFATSKILAFINLVGLTKNSGSNGVGVFQLVRNGTGIYVWDSLVGYIGGTGTWSGQSSTNYLDSPATTSAITYTIQWKISNTATLQINNYDNTPSYSTSTITLMEIAA
jgi:hypothetical protein